MPGEWCGLTEEQRRYGLSGSEGDWRFSSLRGFSCISPRQRASPHPRCTDTQRPLVWVPPRDSEQQDESFRAAEVAGKKEARIYYYFFFCSLAEGTSYYLSDLRQVSKRSGKKIIK